MKIRSGLGKGFLAQEIPPCFSSANYAYIADHIHTSNSKNETYPVRYSIARTGGVRRMIEIPNPLSQYHLVKECSENWETLRSISARSKISLSRPLRDGKVRSLRWKSPIYNRDREIVARMPGGRVTLKTDISQFYPSVYTHAIDWCVRGKSKAKKDRFGSSLGPSLDRLIRNSRGGQTIGLSIGPDTSWLIAEVILGRIDERVARIHPSSVRRSVRFGDDMTVFATSIGEAEDMLATYQSVLLDYELAINPVKVAILDGLAPVNAPWIRRLRAHRYRDDRDTNLAKDVVDLFDLAHESQRQYGTDGVLSYAIKRCNPFPGGADSWPVYRDLVLACIGVEPSTLPHAHAVLEFAYRHGLKVDGPRVSEALNEMLEYHARLEHGFETSWILHIMRNLALDLDVQSAKSVAAMDDNCSLVLLRDICETSSRLRNGVSLDEATQRAERSGSLSSRDWLLAYEYRHHGWCRPKKWDESQSWKGVHDAKVSFLSSKHRGRSRMIQRDRPSFVDSWAYGP